MTGLILKDFLILRKTLRSYLLILAIYVAVAFAGYWSSSFVGGFMMVMVALLPMNVFAYDKQARWDVYGLSLPVGRTKTVAARYLAVLIMFAASAVLTTVLGVAMSIAGRMEESLGEYMLSCAICVVVAMLVNAMMLPFLYKFGPERARMMFYGVLGLFVLAGALLLFPLGGLEWLKSLEIAEPTFAQAVLVPVAAALAGLALLAVSFLLSRHFYGSKDV
ncbi:MAG: ABC-2 transporter permease [Oscillospiraceae bacterium]|jgi:ABC-2 type transport system permease protein|nr:ABC-2 transporter permease [Oscillospiraceae bacterium]